jgi:hypothetical protein
MSTSLLSADIPSKCMTPYCNWHLCVQPPCLTRATKWGTKGQLLTDFLSGCRRRRRRWGWGGCGSKGGDRLSRWCLKLLGLGLGLEELDLLQVPDKAQKGNDK